MSKILQSLKKNSTIKETSIISKSQVYGTSDVIPTPVPILNLAMSGDLDGGFRNGLTIFAGPSKHFKTLFTLLCARSYLDKYPDAALLFYDSEFGSPPEYFRALGIDPERVIHTPIKSVEELRSDISNQLNGIEKGDKVFIAIDSLGNLASNKETEDAMSGKNVADMTRAKQIKSLFRIVTPHLSLKDLPLMVVSHTYKSQDMYPKDIVSGGTGQTYSANNIFVIGKRVEKDGKEQVGNEFVVKVEKSRFVTEGSKFPVTVSFDGGIQKYSGLLDIAIELGYVTSESKGWYEAINPETGEILTETKVRRSDTEKKEFWKPLFEKTDIKEAIKRRYQISTRDLINEEDSGEEIAAAMTEKD